MTVVVWVFALLTAAIHILVFCWESLLFHRPGIHQGVFATPTTDVPTVRLWSFNVGFYNLFIGLGLMAGVILWTTGNQTAGRTLVIYLCLFTFLAGIVLFVSVRSTGREGCSIAPRPPRRKASRDFGGGRLDAE